MKIGLIMLALAGTGFLTAVAWSVVASDVETPNYEVISKSGNYEIRRYDPIIVAQATVDGSRSEAINRGFGVIAAYIFGSNVTSKQVAMTAPVSQQSNESIAMTAPVIQQSEGASWNVRFVMPAEYSMETLPQPVNPDVSLINVPARQFAAIRFSGFGGQSSLDRHTADLFEYITNEGLAPQNTPEYAFYNAPWTLPFMRRNEVMIEVAM